MMTFMLDTDTCVQIIRKKTAPALRKLHRHIEEGVYISSITFSELVYGVEKSSRPDINRSALAGFLLFIRTADYGEDAAETYGMVRSVLERQGRPIGPLDTLIAAHALSMSSTLVTNNIREFSRIPGLRIENWLAS